MANTANDWVVLNVGGERIHTTRLTLTRVPNTLLTAMFEPDSAFSLARDETGAVLIDRDGRYFRVLLNYLRHGSLIIDPGLSTLGVYEEARFFGLHELAADLAPELPECPAILKRLGSWGGQPNQSGSARGIKTLHIIGDSGLLCGCADGRMILWQPMTSSNNSSSNGSSSNGSSSSWQMVAAYEFVGHEGEVASIAYLDSLSRLFSASHDHTYASSPQSMRMHLPRLAHSTREPVVCAQGQVVGNSTRAADADGCGRRDGLDGSSAACATLASLSSSLCHFLRAWLTGGGQRRQPQPQ